MQNTLDNFTALFKKRWFSLISSNLICKVLALIYKFIEISNNKIYADVLWDNKIK